MKNETKLYHCYYFNYQQPGDEQMENETDEQFEERVLNKRAAQMFVSVRARLQKQDSIHLSEMTYRNNRKQVNIPKKNICTFKLILCAFYFLFNLE